MRPLVGETAAPAASARPRADRQAKITTTGLRLTARQHAELYRHLFPGDGLEAVALALCGQSTLLGNPGARWVVCVHKLVAIPYEDCFDRRHDLVHWSTNLLPDLLAEADKKGQILLKIHSHPTGVEGFSRLDDVADRELFSGAAGWLDTSEPGLSAIMLPSGRLLARSVSDGGDFRDVDRVSITGPDIIIWDRATAPHSAPPGDRDRRTAQVFGQATTRLLSRLRVGVVGASGTGSAVVEQLYRLGVGELVVTDPDVVEEKNVGRIYNSSMSDAAAERPKVDVLEEAVLRSGLATRVTALPLDVFDPRAVLQLAHCDILFGCMDSVDGRELLNRLASFYSLPLIDLGVRIDADGRGGVDQIAGQVHYVVPDGPTLVERQLYTAEELQGAALKRDNPEMYEEQREEGYVKGVREDRPAVISVNTLAAALAVNDLLARLHAYRDDDNTEVDVIRFSLTQNRVLSERLPGKSGAFSRHVGRADVRPLLDMPALSR